MKACSECPFCSYTSGDFGWCRLEQAAVALMTEPCLAIRNILAGEVLELTEVYDGPEEGA